MESIKEILIDTYGEDLVNDKSFRISIDSDEDIYYLENVCNIQKKDEAKGIAGQYYITNQQSARLEQICELMKYTRESKKAFLFLEFEGFEEYIFSIEVKSFKGYGHVQFQHVEKIDKKLKENKDDIVRFYPEKQTNKGVPRENEVDVVAIKIGPKDNRDYTALKNFIVSSDNRTYTKVVRNMIEYIEVENKKIPGNVTELPYNLLVAGAPGTGKSHFLAKKVVEAGKDIITEIKNSDNSQNTESVKETTANQHYCSKYVTRVTFYEDYSYENFIGCYKPIPSESKAEIMYCGNAGEIKETKIVYDYVSGPFVDTYVKALEDKEHNYFLIIEEINRAKAASVFGDIFQLLDRDSNGISKYSIKPDAALNKYLGDVLGDKYDGFMKLPHNMYIWATMNSADQGVMPLDSAFKRRWSSMYMDINGSVCDYSMWMQKSITEIGKIKWNELRKKINDIILNNGFDEDRCIGPWYFSETEIAQIENYYTNKEDDNIYLINDKDRLTKVNPLIDKLFFYLRQDVFRRNPSIIFNNREDGITMSDIRRRVRQGENIETILNLGEELTWSSITEVAIYDSNDGFEGNDVGKSGEI